MAEAVHRSTYKRLARYETGVFMMEAGFVLVSLTAVLSIFVKAGLVQVTGPTVFSYGWETASIIGALSSLLGGALIVRAVNP